MESPAMQVYRGSKATQPLIKQYWFSLPITAQGSLSLIPNYPFCTLGVLNAEGEWGMRKGIAFVVQDNYLLTCASNCYSHQYGIYPNITFTINSNRKHAHNVYEVAKVFIPQQYKLLPQNERNNFNYALLYIEGEPNLKDKYGSLPITFNLLVGGMHQSYFECAINSDDQLEMIAEHSLKDKLITSLHGIPTITRIQGYPCVDGLIIQEANPQNNFALMRFNFQAFTQIEQWTLTQSGTMVFNNISPMGMDLSCFTGIEANPMKSINMNQCQLNGEKYRQTFEKFPFSSLLSLNVSNSTEIELEFLKMNKFRHLKHLAILNSNIGPIGCKNIVEASLPNLRILNLIYNPLGDKGWEHLSAGNWPLLQNLFLNNCNVDSKSIQYSAKWRNLIRLEMSRNNCKPSPVFDMADFPRIHYLGLSGNDINGLDLLFIKHPNWQWLDTLDLSSNPVGNSGCKKIKQAGITLRALYLTQCSITAVGIKWLCKANISKMGSLFLYNNNVGDEACLHLRNLSQLSRLSIFNVSSRETNITARGVKLLLSANWTEWAFFCIFIDLKQISVLEPLLLIDLFKGKVPDQYLGI